MPFAAWTETLLKDLRYATRQFARNPVFTAVAVASLAIGIGANTAIFSVLNAAMLKSLPVRDPQTLVMLTNPNTSGVSSGMDTGERGMLTYTEFTQIRDHSATLASLCVAQAQMNRWQVRIGNGAQEEAKGKLVSEEYFSVLGVEPAIGRFFTADEAKGPGQDPYAILSYDYWQKRFGGNVSILGTPIKLLGTTLTVIGVAAPGFTGESVAERPDFWMPMMMQPIVMPGRDWLHEDLGKSMEKVMWLHAFGRLKPGMTQARAQTEMDVLFRGIIENGYPATLDPEARKEAMDQHIKLHDARIGVFGGREEFAQQLLVLLGASVVVLLIACINVANLLLARAASRSKEVGVRLSIGASRGRLVRQFLTESLVLSVLGGAVGVLLAWGASRALVLLLTERRQDFGLAPALDLRVLAFTAAVTFLTGVIFGLVPALRGTRVNLNDSLRDSGRTTASGSKLNLAKGLVIVQVALSLLLVAGAGLFLRTLWNLQSVGLGYPKEHLLMVTADGVTAGFKDARLSNLWRDLTERLRALPGVQGATYSENGLFSGSESGDEIEVEGFIPSKDNEKSSRFDMVGPQYFSTIGIPMLLGRELAQQDTSASPHVCVINEAFAKRFFAGRNPLGRHVTAKFGDKRNVMEVVGVAKNARDHRLRGDVPPRYYLPGDQGMQGPNEWATFAIRTAGDPEQMIASVRKTILSVNENLPVEGARPLIESVDRTNAQPRMVARLCSIFGIMALLLASTGLYGVLSYGVARRTNEIGIRMALGAGRGRVIQMILRETAVMIVVGVVAGTIFTAIGVQLIKSKLFGLGVLDPAAVLSAVGILTVVALVAGYIPAARAARVNPTQALRHE
ncbi:MAG TPA: ABC transporter permease, partial [Candidatus Angelobacter sp.]|nr:ABC transporter permease [Candidatus Angelobacter sp.]